MAIAQGVEPAWDSGLMVHTDVQYYNIAQHRTGQDWTGLYLLLYLLFGLDWIGESAPHDCIVFIVVFVFSVVLD